MGRNAGGKVVSDGLETLRQTLYEYYGAINEIEAGIFDKKQSMPEKPEALIYTEQMIELGIPLVHGGVLDQPYIFMQEYKICIEVKRLFERLNQQKVTDNEVKRIQQELTKNTGNLHKV